MKFFKKLWHLRKVRSVSWGRLAHAAPLVYLDYRSGSGRSRSLLNTTIEITYRCNARCAFCLAAKDLPDAGRVELSAAEIGAAAAPPTPAKTSFFITGGEPFVRPDLIDIVARLKQRRGRVGINTNMTLVDAATARELRQVGLDYLIASLLGPKEVHDRLACLDAHDKALEGIALLRRHHPRLRVLTNCVMVPENSDSLAKVVEDAAGAGAHAVVFQHETYITPRERVAHAACWAALRPEDAAPCLCIPAQAGNRMEVATLREAMQAAESRGRELNIPVFFKPDLQGEELGGWYADGFFPGGRCSYLYTDARITPYGDVVACQSLPLVFGNIRERPLTEILNGDRAVWFRKTIQAAGGTFPGCTRCCKLYRKF